MNHNSKNNNLETPVAFNVVLIPAYEPDEKLLLLVKELSEKKCHIVIVNDGSQSEEAKVVFQRLEQVSGVNVLHHITNLGKGAALKTGLNYSYLKYPNLSGVITADADGQHLVDDILKVGSAIDKDKNRIVLGVREFTEDVPFRSRFGNKLTCILLKIFTGIKIQDTQTGLRGVPRILIPDLLKIESNRYDFEMDVLISTKILGIEIAQVPIQTVYIENNKSSHFNPITDSMKIYFVLFRFSASSIATALLDCLVFSVGLFFGASILNSQLLARLVAGIFNYTVNRDIVFKGDQRTGRTLFKYCLLVIANISISYVGIISLIDYFSFPVITAKIFSETLLYLASFTIQRELIFKKQRA